jgi:hypothetical protein
MSKPSSQEPDRVTSVLDAEVYDVEKPQHHENHSKGGILKTLKGEFDHELTYFERKAALINE